MVNYQGFPGVAFIAGRTFQTEYGTHEAGTVVKEAPLFPNLDVLVSAGLLHPYSPGNGYEYLPPHLFTDTNLKSEIEAYMQGDTTPSATPQFPDGEKPEVMQVAEREAEQQEELYEALKRRPAMKVADDTRTQAPPEAVNKPSVDKDEAAKKTAAKPAAKKTAAPTKKD
jgi:hypothetical protein